MHEGERWKELELDDQGVDKRDETDAAQPDAYEYSCKSGNLGLSRSLCCL